jgi:hypothetical protein
MPIGEGGVGQPIIVIAVILLVVGLVVSAAENGKLPIGKWKLPGDVSYHRGPVHVWMPIGTSIVLSIVLTVLLNLLFRR